MQRACKLEREGERFSREGKGREGEEEKSEESSSELLSFFLSLSPPNPPNSSLSSFPRFSVWLKLIPKFLGLMRLALGSCKLLSALLLQFNSVCSLMDDFDPVRFASYSIMG